MKAVAWIVGAIAVAVSIGAAFWASAVREQEHTKAKQACVDAGGSFKLSWWHQNPKCKMPRRPIDR